MVIHTRFNYVNQFFSRIPFSVKYVFRIYLLGILFFTLFRILLFFSNFSLLDGVSDKLGVSFHAFVIGLRFDTVICCYFLSLPLLFLTVADMLGRPSLLLFRIICIYLLLVFTCSFFICAADIPFFKQFNTRLNSSALLWSSTPGMVFSMVTREWSYFEYFLLFIFIALLFYIFFAKINRQNSKQYSLAGNLNVSPIHFLKKMAICVTALFLLFLGIRGRTSLKSPIRAGTAFFCNNRFLNQLGLNPVFTFSRSCLDDLKQENRSLRFLDNSIAVSNAQHYFLDGVVKDTAISPIARKITPSSGPVKKNIILVLMESMTAGHMVRYGATKKLTPTLDSLAVNGYAFDNAYSAGIHTYNGIFSTLFSFPGLMNKNMLSNVEMPEYSGFPKVLKDNGYHTLFATTHDGQFDNLNGFLRANNFEKIISQKDYPRREIVSTWGVPDHYMFEFVIPRLTELNKSKNPFFAALLTTSNHRPFYIPKDIPFTPDQQDEKLGIIEYADWAIRHFLNKASKEPWFDNTIFILVADHGAIIEREIYSMPIYYHHVPLIIYSPSFLKPVAFEQLIGQIDIFPTIMGLLHFNYINNTFGVDVLKHPRPYIYFSADDKIGVISKQYFYIWQKEGPEELYDYRSNSTINFAPDKKVLADSMKNYAFTFFQSAQWLINNHKTGLTKKGK